MEKQYTLNTLLGEVTASSKVLNEFICGYFAIAHREEKAGYMALAMMHREQAGIMYNELKKINERRRVTWQDL